MRRNQQVENLDDLIIRYKTFGPAEMKNVREKIKARINKERTMFEKKIKTFISNQSKAPPIYGLNLILGSTGSGKSTLFNFISGLPLIVQQGRDKTGKKTGVALIKVEDGYLQRNMSNVIYSPIGNGFISQTTQPIFSREKSKNYANVDCPGEFDNKELIQSIINSLLRIDVCGLAPQLKYTIVVNFYQLMNNRASAFKFTLAAIEKIFGGWDRINVDSVCLVVTHIPADYNHPNIGIKNQLQEILQNSSHDLNKFVPILTNIIKKGLFCVMPMPSKEIKSQKNTPNGKLQFYIPEGKPYSPQRQTFSHEMILNLLQKIGYTKLYEGLLCPAIKQESLIVMNDICQSLIKQIRQSMLLASKNKIKFMKKPQLLTCSDKLKYLKSIEEIKKMFSMHKDLQKNKLIDLQYFIRMTSIKSIHEQIFKVSKDIFVFIQESINILDQKQLQMKRKQKERQQKELKRKNDLNNHYQRLSQVQQRIDEKVQELDSLKKDMKIAKKDEKKVIKQQVGQCTTNLKQLDEEWNEIKDSIQYLQTDDQKMQKKTQVEMYDQDLQQNEYNLSEIQLNEKIERLIKTRQKWMSFKNNKHSKNHIYLLSVERRIKQIKERIKASRQCLKQKVQQKYVELERNQQEIQQQIGNIQQNERYRQEYKQDRIYYTQKIKESKQRLEQLQESWKSLKDDISDYQQQVDKEERQNDLQYDEDLSKEIDDSELDFDQLTQKMKRLTENLKKWKKSLAKKNANLLQKLKLERRISKLQSRYESCLQLQQNFKEQNDTY